MKLIHIALCLLALTPVPTFAQIVVSYSDLNLRSEAGVKELDRRLANAIRSVCGEPHVSGILWYRPLTERCVKATSAEVAVLRDRAIARNSSPATLGSR